MQWRPLILHQIPFFISEIRLAEVGLDGECGVVSHLHMGTKSVKNTSSLYLGESFPFLRFPFRAEPAQGSHSCHALWRGKTGKQRPCVLLELLCQPRAGTDEGEHLHHTMNCTVLLFLKRSFHALSQQRDRSRGCSWLGARLHPTAGGPHTPGALEWQPAQ